MNEKDIDNFIVLLEAKNSWGKNEVIELFRDWVIRTLLTKGGE